MSTATPALTITPTARAAGRTRFLGKNVWAIGDQALISGSNFVTMVLLARALGASAFGTFSLAYSVLLLANIFQSTLITQPHNVLGSARTGVSYGRFTFTMGAFQLVLVAGEALIALLAAGWAGLHHYAVAPLLFALVLGIVGWQLQEFVRRVMYTESRFRDAFINDCISYGGQTLAVIVLWQMNLLHGETAMYALAATSLTAALFGLWQIRGSLVPHYDPEAIRESWHFGKWLTGGELLQWSCSLQMYLYLAAIILGTAAAGELRAAQILFGPTRVLAFYLGSVLPIRFARALANGGNAAVQKQLVETAIRILPWLGLYAVCVAIFAHPLLKVLYRDEFASDALVLVVYSAAAFVEYVQVMFTSALSAKRMTRSIFFGQLCGIFVTAGVSWWIIRLFGVTGAPMALGISSTIITFMFWRSYKASMTLATAPISSASLSATHGDLSDASFNEPTEQDTARVELLGAVFAALAKHNVPFCVTHGYADLDRVVSSDVDCIIPASYRRADLLPILRSAVAGARVVQWLDDGAVYIAVAAGGDRSPTMVQLHVSVDFELAGKVFYTGEEIIAARRPHGAMFVPPPQVEFACVLLNRLHKSDLSPAHADRLMDLFNRAPEACEREIRRFWHEAHAATIMAAVRSGDWDAVRTSSAAIAADSRATGPANAVLRRSGEGLRATARKLKRWIKPEAGYHIVFLGPDGVGKSTIIEQVRDAIAPAFLDTSYHTFAPSLIPHKFQPEKPTPHAFPPRGKAASFIKAAWWSVCYTVGYAATIHPDRVRGVFAMNHRYLLDAIVDPKRYRYSGPTSILRAIWAIAPKPDMVVLLDAPAEVIQARKKEVAFEETARQRREYTALISGMPYGVIINANRPIDEVVADVNGRVLKHLADRIEDRVGKGQ